MKQTVNKLGEILATNSLVLYLDKPYVITKLFRDRYGVLTAHITVVADIKYYDSDVVLSYTYDKNLIGRVVPAAKLVIFTKARYKNKSN